MTVCAGDTIKLTVSGTKVRCEELLQSQRPAKSLSIQYKLCLLFEGSEREYARRDICWSKMMQREMPALSLHYLAPSYNSIW